MRPNIDSHDYEVKMRAVKRFFDEGDKVKLTCASAVARWCIWSSGRSRSTKVREEVAPIAKVQPSPARRPPDDDGAGAGAEVDLRLHAKA